MNAHTINRFCFFVLVLLLELNVLANNVQVTNLTYDANANTLNFDVSWENSFYVDANWQDNIYLFAKYKNANGSSWDRVTFDLIGHSDNSGGLALYATNAQGGERIALRIGHLGTSVSGSQSLNCTAKLNDNLNLFHPSFKVFAIEMVVRSSILLEYYIGDGTSQYRYHMGGDTTQSVQYTNSSSLTVGNASGEINTLHPDGIPVTSIPFHTLAVPDYVMRYEISQMQYVEFLNCLNRTAQNNRVLTDISGTSITDVFVMTTTPSVASFSRNGVRCDATLPNGGPITFYCDYNGNGIPNEYDDGQNIAMNYLSAKSLFAYLDWAGLRPLNELQYEGICRGEYAPVPNEFAWGTSGFTQANINTGSTAGSPDEFLNGAPLIGPMRSSQLPMRCGAAATATTNRVTSGSSALGIMDLSGNVAELVIALTHASSFDPVVNGDGIIGADGNSDEGWPVYISHKGGYISNEAYTVSQRKETVIPYVSPSAFFGGRGGF